MGSSRAPPPTSPHTQKGLEIPGDGGAQSESHDQRPKNGTESFKVNKNCHEIAIPRVVGRMNIF